MADRQSRLRVGAVVDSLWQPDWILRLLSRVQGSDVAELVLVIHRERRTPSGSLPSAYSNQLGRLLFRLYLALDGFLFSVQRNASQPRYLPECLPGCTLRSQAHHDGDHQQDAAPKASLTPPLDVLLQLGSISYDARLPIAKFGVWWVEYGDGHAAQTAPGVLELMAGLSVISSRLMMRSTPGSSDAVTIYETHSATDRRSIMRTLNNCFWKGSEFPLRKLNELRHRGPTALTPVLRAQPVAPTASKERVAILTGPTRLLGRLVIDKVREATHSERWVLGTRFLNSGDSSFRLVFPPRGRFWADPFPISYAGRYFVFFEEGRPEDNGKIQGMELYPSGELGVPFTALCREYHLAYPFTFQWNGQWFMVPETQENRTVELYRCRTFPDDWELCQVLLDDVRAVDATLAEIEGEWWLFVSLGIGGGWNGDELSIFHASSPLGPWRPHRRNPVKSDVRSSRPAGRLFFERGRLIRPSQDCSSRYGRAVVFNEVLRLSLDEFEEIEVSRIDPDWDHRVSGVHTFNNVGELTVIDCRLRRPRMKLSQGLLGQPQSCIRSNLIDDNVPRYHL